MSNRLIALMLAALAAGCGGGSGDLIGPGDPVPTPNPGPSNPAPGNPDPSDPAPGDPHPGRRTPSLKAARSSPWISRTVSCSSAPAALTRWRA